MLGLVREPDVYLRILVLDHALHIHHAFKLLHQVLFVHRILYLLHKNNQS